jgi:hypothetical protein
MPSWELPKTVSLEKGQKYYWKIRVSQAATGEVGDGNWSKTISFSIASAPEESSQSGSPPLPSSDNTTEETKHLPWILNIPLWAWIAIAFLLIVVPIVAFLAHKAKR